MPNQIKCPRCSHDVTKDVIRRLDDGGGNQCPVCTLALPDPSEQWLVANGYHVDDNDSD